MTMPNVPPPEVRGGRYVPRGMAAIDPLALSVDYCFPAATACEPPEPEPLATVSIRGPLTFEFQVKEGFDTYEFIRYRFDAALAREPKAIILRIASPGGDVSGSFELARYMRKRAEAAGVKLIAHSEAQICSAAYVLACAASEIYCTETASIGSIGVIVQPVDATRADAAQGLKFAIISSGEHKADGNPHTELTPEARSRIQATVDTMANVFFEHVGAARGKRLTAKAAQALQAGIRVGHDALGAGLVDGVLDFEELAATYCDASSDEATTTGGTIGVTAAIAAASTPPSSMSAKAAADDKCPPEKKEDAVRASLVTASTSDDPEKASRAKRALASYDTEDDDKDEKKKEAKAKAEAAAAVARAAAESAHSATLAEVSARLAAFEAKALADERAALFASRPDLPKASLDAVKDLPVATAKAILDTIPKIGASSNPLAPPQASVGTVGNPTINSTSSPLSATEVSALDAAFGLTPKAVSGVAMNGILQQFGVSVPAATGVSQ